MTVLATVIATDDNTSMAIVECASCEAVFDEWTTYDGRPHRRVRRRFCSRACAHVGDQLASRARRAERRATPRPCWNCNRPIIGRTARARFCNPNCATSYRYKRKANPTLPDPKPAAQPRQPTKHVLLVDEYTPGVCPYCGGGFDPAVSHEGFPRRKGSRPRIYCSVECRSKLASAKKQPAMKERALRDKYGLEYAEYLSMVEAQGNRCAICRQPERVVDAKGRTRSLAVDHDHVTGRVRGLLCQACNFGIGSLGDNAERLRSALRYLERSNDDGS